MPVWFVQALLRLRVGFTFFPTLVSVTVFIAAGVLYSQYHWEIARWVWIFEILWLVLGLFIHVLFSLALFLWSIHRSDACRCSWLGESPIADDVIIYVLCGPQKQNKGV